MKNTNIAMGQTTNKMTHKIFGLLLFLVLLIAGCQRKRLYDKTEGETYARKRIQEVLADTIYAHDRGQQILVNNGELAIKIVEPILFDKYGEEMILDEKPYQAFKVDNYWLVRGSTPDDPNFEGGAFEIIIDSRDARVVRVIHYK